MKRDNLTNRWNIIENGRREREKEGGLGGERWGDKEESVKRDGSGGWMVAEHLAGWR